MGCSRSPSGRSRRRRRHPAIARRHVVHVDVGRVEDDPSLAPPAVFPGRRRRECDRRRRACDGDLDPARIKLHWVSTTFPLRTRAGRRRSRSPGRCPRHCTCYAADLGEIQMGKFEPPSRGLVDSESRTCFVDFLALEDPLQKQPITTTVSRDHHERSRTRSRARRCELRRDLGWPPVNASRAVVRRNPGCAARSARRARPVLDFAGRLRRGLYPAPRRRRPPRRCARAECPSAPSRRGRAPPPRPAGRSRAASASSPRSGSGRPPPPRRFAPRGRRRSPGSPRRRRAAPGVQPHPDPDLAPSGHACSRSARCAATAALTASRARGNEKKNASPCVSISVPPAAPNVSRTIRRWSRDSVPNASSPSSCRSFVDPSMSVNANVTVPAWSELTRTTVLD